MVRGKHKNILFLAMNLCSLVIQSTESFFSCLKSQTGIENIFERKQEGLDFKIATSLFSFMNDWYKKGMFTIAVGTYNKNFLKRTLPYVNLDTAIQGAEIAQDCHYKDITVDILAYDNGRCLKECFQRAGISSSRIHVYELLAQYQKDDNALKQAYRNFRDQSFTGLKTQTQELLLKIDDKYPGYLDQYCNSYGVQRRVRLLGYHGDFDEIASQLIAIEQEDYLKGYTTFLHGRSWDWNYVNDVWNIICALRDHKDVMFDTISMRQRGIECDKDRLYITRSNLSKNGNIGDYVVSSTDGDLSSESSEVTFLNYTGFSHSNDGSLCSMSYALRNYSHGNGYSIAKELIKKYGLQKYQDKFDSLYEAHKRANPYGELLVVSVANDKVNDIVWPAVRGGYRYSDGTKASDVVAECIEKIKDKNNNYIQTSVSIFWENCPIFCAGAVSIPGEGEDVIKIRSIHRADSEKYDMYKQQRQRLVEELKDQKILNT